MGVLNVTPDSFSDGGRYLDQAGAVARGKTMVEEGARVLDVGGESTRPGAAPVGEDEELSRVVPVVEELAACSAVIERSVRISIDTRHAAVAVAAVAAGATIVNDVSASLHEVAADLGVGWVAMHMKGDPLSMQEEPAYESVVAEVYDFLMERATKAVAAGVPEIWIDPGIGFGKTTAHNLALLHNLDLLVGAGWPLVLGASRKRFLGELSARSNRSAQQGDWVTPTDDRAEASVAMATWAFSQGVKIVRAHDVRATVIAAKVVG